MATNKPILQVILEKETLDKFSELCKEEKRSKSNQASLIIEKWIDQKNKEKAL